MTVKLTSNFLANSRGFTLTDGGGIAWSINASTNEVTATGSAGGVISTITLADGSTVPIFTGSTLTGNGTLSLTLKTQSANLVLAGPSSGPAAQPTFRVLVLADIPTGYAYSSLSGAPSIPIGANPSAKVGTAAVNGSAATFMRSDGAPQIDQAMSPTWSGTHVFSGTINATGANGYELNGVAQFQSGTFLGTLTGMSSTTTGTFHYTIAGNICTISLANAANVTGTSNANTMTLTGLPAVCQPATQYPCVPCFLEDNGTGALGAAQLSAGSGTIQFLKAVVSGSAVGFSSAGFTTSGAKGMDSTVITYSLQ